MRFCQLKVGQTFDFIKPDSVMNSFFLRCEKINERQYKDENGTVWNVGTIRCRVYNVGSAPSLYKEDSLITVGEVS